MMESIDLLFAKVNGITHQTKMEAKMDMSNKVIEQMIKDQEKLAKQIDSSGHVVAQLRMEHKEMEAPPSPTFFEYKDSSPFHMNCPLIKSD
jgi:hypothetical protein